MSEAATLCILAGGEARRMGRPKGELFIGEKPIIGYLLDRLAWPGPTMLVTAPGREHPPGWQRVDRELVDPVSGAGPLRGLLTALENLQTPVAIVLSVDMPMIDATHVHWLLDTLQARPNAVGIMTRRGAIQPFPSVFRSETVNIVRAQMQGNNRALVSLAEERGIITVDPPDDWDARVWTNLNTPEEFREFVARQSS